MPKTLQLQLEFIHYRCINQLLLFLANIQVSLLAPALWNSRSAPQAPLILGQKQSMIKSSFHIGFSLIYKNAVKYYLHGSIFIHGFQFQRRNSQMEFAAICTPCVSGVHIVTYIFAWCAVNTYCEPQCVPLYIVMHAVFCNSL